MFRSLTPTAQKHFSPAGASPQKPYAERWYLHLLQEALRVEGVADPRVTIRATGGHRLRWVQDDQRCGRTDAAVLPRRVKG